MQHVRVQHASFLIENVLPGWDLMKSLDERSGWRKNYYGLVSNAEYLITSWFGAVIPDPYGLRSEEESLFVGERWDLWCMFGTLASDMDRNWELSDPVDAYRFVKLCIDAGYDIDKHGARLSYWLAHWIAIAVLQTEAIEIDEAMSAFVIA